MGTPSFALLLVNLFLSVVIFDAIIRGFVFVMSFLDYFIASV